MTALTLSMCLGLLGALGCGGEGEDETMLVPSGTSMTVSLTSSISTETATEGQTFEAETTEPVRVDQQRVVPAGSTIRGAVTHVQKPGNVKGGAEITLDFREIVANGSSYSIATAPITLAAEPDTDADIERLAAGTVAGAVIGGIAKGGEGAAIGALIGAGAGGTWAVATKGDQIVLNPGQKFRIETTEAVELPAPGNE